MGEARSRYEATVGADGRIQGLVERTPGAPCRAISPESREGVGILAAGWDILYRFDEERRLRNRPYPEVLEGMRQEILLTLHKVSHGELLDEPDLIPILRRLLVDLEAVAGAFQEACQRLRMET